MADDGSIALPAETLIPGDRVRYGSLLLLCDIVTVSVETVTIEGTKLTPSAGGALIDTGVRSTLSLSAGEHVRTLPPAAIAFGAARPLI